MLLQQGVLAPVAAIRGITQVLGTVSSMTRRALAQKIHLHFPALSKGMDSSALSRKKAPWLMAAFPPSEKETLALRARGSPPPRREQNTARRGRKARGESPPRQSAALRLPRSPFPLRINGQRNLHRPAGNSAGGKKNFITNVLISPAAFVRCARQHRHIKVGVVVNAHLAFSFVQPMKAARVFAR